MDWAIFVISEKVFKSESGSAGDVGVGLLER